MSSMKSIFQYSTAKIITVIMAVIVLSACGPGSDEKSVNDNTPPTEGDITPTLFSQDSVHQHLVGEPITISLADKVTLSSDEPLEINSVALLSDNPNCQIVATSEMTISLAPQASPGLCQLQYTAKTKEPSPITYQSERMLAQIIVTDAPVRLANTATFSSPLSAAALPPISATVTDTSTVQTINLASQLATLYPTDADDTNYILSNSILVLGKGTAVKSGDSSITYTPDSNDEGGITRVLYSLTDDFDGDGNGNFIVGSVDISVSERIVNQAPVANHFNWNNNGAGIVLGTKYTIDVTNIIDGNCSVENNDGNTATNSCITDPDTSDELQLVGVFAYDAIVAPTSLTALDSTQFDVTFNRTGIHDITYYISDHAGGYAIGIMRVDIPHNLAPVFDGPEIISLTAGTSKNVTGLSVVDPEGKAVTITNISTPSEGSITNINNTNLTFTYTPLTTTVGLIPIKVTFTDADGFSAIGDVIFTVNPINTLTPKADRNVTTDVRTAVHVDVSNFIDGLAKDGSGTVTEVITVTDTFGSQLGTTTIDSTDPNIIIYTPNNNVYGVDDFAFSITTDLGNQLSSDITVTIGSPPPLVIQDIDATEDEATEIITASVTCSNCDVTKYQYSWYINGTKVSTEQSFKIQKKDRAYIVMPFT